MLKGSDAAHRLLDHHKKEFAGVDWMPANFFQRKRIIYIRQRLQKLYNEFEEIDFEGMPGEAQLTKTRYRMWVDLRLLERWQVKDHIRFFASANAVLKGAGTIFERLKKMDAAGRLPKPTTPTKPRSRPQNLMD